MGKLTYTPSTAPNYGAHKQQVIAFLRELVMKGHKPKTAITIADLRTGPELWMQCEHCYRHLSYPVEGTPALPWCERPEGRRKSTP